MHLKMAKRSISRYCITEKTVSWERHYIPSTIASDFSYLIGDKFPSAWDTWEKRTEKKRKKGKKFSALWWCHKTFTSQNVAKEIKTVRREEEKASHKVGWHHHYESERRSRVAASDCWFNISRVMLSCEILFQIDLFTTRTTVINQSLIA